MMSADDAEQIAADDSPATDQPQAEEPDNTLLNAAAEIAEDPVPSQPAACRPVLSPDGTMVAILQPDSTGTVRLWIVPVDAGEPAALELDLDLVANPHGARWSPDGGQLVLSAPHPADGRDAIWVIQRESAFARLLVDHPGADSEPVWSPDGAWIAFLSSRDGRSSTMIVPADGLGGAIQVSSAPAGLNDHSLTWARDSSRIAYAQQAIDGDKRGDQIYTYDLRTGTTKQVTTRLIPRHSLTWAPDRNLIMHTAEDAEWDQIAVVNADNSSGWNIAAEKGDKFEATWSKDGTRVAYARRFEGVVRVAERGTSTATSEALDPGEGEARWPQILSDKRVLYVYSSPTAGPTIFVQEPKADAERQTIANGQEWQAGRTLRTPVHQAMTIGEVTSGALVYRWTEQSGPIPAVIVLRDHLQDAVVSGFDALEQALSATGFVVVVPTLPGTPGEGRKVSSALSERVDFEGDIEDILAVIEAVRAIPDIDPKRIGLVGSGSGAALAMVLAGSRPDVVQAVAVVDPVCDWNAEFDASDAPTRQSILARYGLPATNHGRYAVRTPATFAGIIQTPLLLLGTDTAPAGRAAQLDGLTTILRDLDHPAVHDVSVGEGEWTAMERVATFISEALLATPATIVSTTEATAAADV